MTVGNLLRYGYHSKGSEEHPRYGTLSVSKWNTGIALILAEQKVKQSDFDKKLYQTLRDNNTFAQPQEYDTIFTVLLPDGTKRQLRPVEVSELL